MWQGKENMADFVQKSLIKSSVRLFAQPIDSLATFTTIVQEILDDNPWGCTVYQQSGATVNGVTRSSQYFSGKVIYEDAQAKTVGAITIKGPSAAAFTNSKATVMGTAALGTAMGGTPSSDSSEDAYSTTFKCHAANGEYYSVALKRDRMTISSYEDDTIVATLETWADTIPNLA
jgi:hypothetical protein